MLLTKILHKNIVLKNLGLVSYASAMTIMHELEEKKLNGDTVDYIIACQHHPVYTVGTRKGMDYMKPEMIDNLKNLDAELCYTNRGGLITFHGPGQLVCYPVLDLQHYSLSLRCYIHKLEEVMINSCHDFGIIGQRTDDIGIWIGNNKIAAIGVHRKKYITTHGLALNCNTNLSWFNHIVPCGLHGKGVTSITKELSQEVTVADAFPIVVRNFEKIFDAEIV